MKPEENRGEPRGAAADRRPRPVRLRQELAGAFEADGAGAAGDRGRHAQSRREFLERRPRLSGDGGGSRGRH